MKIAIIGYSGAGKSTLAKKLGVIYNASVLHMDTTHYNPDWSEKSDEEQSSIVNKFMEENSSWVIDGNYLRICPERFTDCDLLIYLNFNRFFCYKQARKRYLANKGKIRDDLAVEDKFNFSFRWWILFSGRTRKRKNKYKTLMNNAKSSIEFRNRKEVNEYISSLGGKKC